MTAKVMMAVFLIAASSSCFSKEGKLDEACKEYLEIKSNMTDFFTTSLREAAQSGYCAGVYHALVESIGHSGLICSIPASSDAFAEVVALSGAVSVSDAIDQLCYAGF